MKVLTVKITDDFKQVINQASDQANVSRAIQAYISEETRGKSALYQVGDLVGCFEGPCMDLSSNPDHLADFGKV